MGPLVSATPLAASVAWTTHSPFPGLNSFTYKMGSGEGSELRSLKSKVFPSLKSPR